MRRAVVDSQLLEHLSAQSGLGKHPSDGLLNSQRGPLRHQPRVADAAKTARIPRMPIEDLGLFLGPREPHPAGVHYDHVVARVGVGGEDRFVLTPEELGHL